VGCVDQSEPTERSAHITSVVGDGRLPTAVHVVSETHDTPTRSPTPGLVAPYCWTDHPVASKRSTKGAVPDDDVE
jgi:hypothetical protein